MPHLPTVGWPIVPIVWLFFNFESWLIDNFDAWVEERHGSWQKLEAASAEHPRLLKHTYRRRRRRKAEERRRRASEGGAEEMELLSCPRPRRRPRCPRGSARILLYFWSLGSRAGILLYLFPCRNQDAHRAGALDCTSMMSFGWGGVCRTCAMLPLHQSFRISRRSAAEHRSSGSASSYNPTLTL